MKTKGEIGVTRRNAGLFMIIITGLMSLLHGFDFYSVDYRIILINGSIGCLLLIAGLSKDVTEIIKAKINKN
jgi:hypothetical protein